MKKSSILKNIFSIKNSPNKKHKIITLLGIQLKFKRLTKYEVRCSDKMYNKLKRRFRKNSVLIIEPNGCHFEVIGGYAKYFSELDYNVDIVLYNPKEINFLSKSMPSVQSYAMNLLEMEKFLKSDFINNYQYVVFNSAVKYLIELNGNSPENPLVTDFFENIAVDAEKIIFVQHHLERSQEDFKQMALADFHNEFSKKYAIVNPHYFGNVKITPKNKDITKFIVVGNISPQRKNYNLLFDTVRELIKKTHDFKIIVVGSGKAIELDAEIAPYFDIRGRLSFDDMFAAMEEADFFLCLLDPENPEHERYITIGTSGSFQLIYGFAKPCLIQKRFADVYDFDNTNSMVYEQNSDLATFMMQAVDMNMGEYQSLQSGLEQKAENIRKLSINNLSALLGKNQ